MNENVKKFMEALQADAELENALNQALEGLKPEEKADAALKFANEKGFDISEADLNPDGQEVSMDELDNVAGGGGCGCAVAGAGGGTDDVDGKTYGCACAGYGQGGDGSASDGNCLCVLVGAGVDTDVMRQ